jgi:putative transposase
MLFGFITYLIPAIELEEMLRYRVILVSYETVRMWSNKFGKSFSNIIKKRKYKSKDKWHLDEMTMKLNGELLIVMALN